MLESIFIMILIVAILFLLITIIWESLSLGIVDVILWLILSISVYQIEIPYTAMQSDDTIITGVQTIETLYPLSWLFMGLAIITMLFLFIQIIFPMLQGKYSRMM